ncbi:Pentatricopeptide repeat-containing protein [Apostasia shenzhenica]|uniref:Pentatricopeptide repeat-containing protein n=1 Tax=Apostasia shenzhenica TaxID=1088818 RepID=A0A2I0AMM7_9ASPA|nr:Pentatricopeptide repeat-containing protein [Apostasia shenzhenica]
MECSPVTAVIISEAVLVFVEMKRDWVPDEPVYGLLLDSGEKPAMSKELQAWYPSDDQLKVLRPKNTPTCNFSYLSVPIFGAAAISPRPRDTV